MAASADPVLDIIRERAIANGVDPDMMIRIGKAESGLYPAATNPQSSASGLFQITKGTWQRYGHGSPTNAYDNADAAARLTSDNIAALRKAGLPVTPANVYLAHFAGPQGAVNILQASPGASVASVLSPEAVKANPFLAKMSVADLGRWATGKMGDGASAAGSGQASPATGTGATSAGTPLSLTPPPSQTGAATPAATAKAISGLIGGGGSELPFGAPEQIATSVPRGAALAQQLAQAIIRQQIAASQGTA